MTQSSDIGSKRLISLDPQGWCRWITQNSALLFQEILNSEFQWLTREGDVLLRVADPQWGEFLITNEIQLRYSPDMPRRMRAYAALAEEKFKLPVYPVLVVILPAPKTQIANQYRSSFQGMEARQDYKVIQLSEVEAEQVFTQPLPPLLPFVPIMKGGEEESQIRRALEGLQRDPKLNELEVLLAFFASFVLESEVVAQIMRWDMTVLRESPWYQEIEQKGIQIGKQEGIQIGIEQVARNLLETGMDPDQIAQLTGLSLEQIQALRYPEL